MSDQYPTLEDRLACLEDDNAEMFEDTQALTHEMMRLQLLITTLANLVHPGWGQLIEDEVTFVLQARLEMQRLEDGDA
jgi:hypothetical protein